MARKNKLLLTITVIATLTIIIGYSFIEGPLFAFTPVIVGFEQAGFNRATIYYRKGIDVTKFIEIDDIIKDVEDFHDLKFKQKVEIIIFRNNEDYNRHTWGSKARFITAPLYGRIFVSGQAAKELEDGSINLPVYLRHELSHSLLFQNMSLYSSQFYPGWLLEGIAVYSAHQMGVDGYFTKEETFAKIKSGYFLDPDDWSTTLLKPQSINVKNFPMPNKYRFIYSEFACVVDDLINNQGKDKFILFMTTLLKDHNDKQVFQLIYGIDFKTYISNFRNRVMGGEASPHSL